MRAYTVTYQRTIVEVVVVEANDDSAAKGLALCGYGVSVGIPYDTTKPKVIDCREVLPCPATVM